MKGMLVSMLAAACVAMSIAGCGGSALPEAPACVPAAATRTAETLNGQVGQYLNEVFAGEDELATLLADFRAEYPEGRFYRSSAFREDWVAYSGAAGCEIDRMSALSAPAQASPTLRNSDLQLEAILAEYRNQLNAGTEAVRQRNTSDYRDFNRRVDDVAIRLSTFLNGLEN
jgi:hypothetical protein